MSPSGRRSGRRPPRGRATRTRSAASAAAAPGPGQGARAPSPGARRRRAAVGRAAHDRGRPEQARVQRRRTAARPCGGSGAFTALAGPEHRGGRLADDGPRCRGHQHLRPRSERPRPVTMAESRRSPRQPQPGRLARATPAIRVDVDRWSRGVVRRPRRMCQAPASRSQCEPPLTDEVAAHGQDQHQHDRRRPRRRRSPPWPARRRPRRPGRPGCPDSLRPATSTPTRPPKIDEPGAGERRVPSQPRLEPGNRRLAHASVGSVGDRR